MIFLILLFDLNHDFYCLIQIRWFKSSNPGAGAWNVSLGSTALAYTASVTIQDHGESQSTVLR